MGSSLLPMVIPNILRILAIYRIMHRLVAILAVDPDACSKVFPVIGSSGSTYHGMESPCGGGLKARSNGEQKFAPLDRKILRGDGLCFIINFSLSVFSSRLGRHNWPTQGQWWMVVIVAHLQNMAQGRRKTGQASSHRVMAGERGDQRRNCRYLDITQADGM